MQGDPALDDLIAVGIVRKAHGVRGEASVESLTASLDRFSELSDVWLVDPDRTRTIRSRVISARPHGERALVRLDVIDSPEAVRPFHNWTIEVRTEDARVLDDDEFFLHDLEGLTAVDVAGNILGVISEVHESAAALLLVVEHRGKRFEVPFVAALCPQVDLEKRTITMDLPEGLSDLDSVIAVEEEPLERADAGSEPHEQDAASDERDEPSLTIDVVTIFPGMFEPLLADGVVARAVRSDLVRVTVHDLREHATDRHKSTDDEAYGGGAGMVMLAEPVARCIDSLSTERKPWVVLMSPQGKPLDQETARELAARGRFAIVCGRYEGLDERVREAMVDEEISVGDFVVSGGEIPAMLLIDAVSRMIDGVVGQRNSVEADSFYNGLLDHPHYTRPAEWRGRRVPDVLLSGHAENIRRWRKEQSLRATLRKRPDLLAGAELDEEGRKMLERLRADDPEVEKDAKMGDA